MRANFQTSYLPQDTGTKREPDQKFVAKPRKNPDIASIRKKLAARYSKTLAYLAK